MQTWCSFCRRSIVFKAYSKHFKRETLTTKQHSYHRYHARKRALAQFKQNIISCIDLSQQTQRTSLISSASIHLFNCTYSCIESGFGFSWTRLTHLGAAFGMAISSAWPCCRLHPWLVAVLKPMHISVLCLPGMALDQNEKLVTQCHSCCHISNRNKLVPSFTQHLNKVYMCFSPLHFHAYRRALSWNKHNKLWWHLLSQKTSLPSKEHMD